MTLFAEFIEMKLLMDKEESFIDDWGNQIADKTIFVQNWSEPEYKVTYRNDAGDKFRVIFKPKIFKMGFHAKW